MKIAALTGGAFSAVVSKSGTGDFHGGARYFHRHAGLNANNFLRHAAGLNPDGTEKQPRALYRDHNVGDDIGGPVSLPFLNFNTQFSSINGNTDLTVPTSTGETQTDRVLFDR
ncbi:MAG TPA: hypothetical protein VJ302_28290 [Blastocatellia bacterium]|nr:hypothetical protein [Blastocatellia bacterium]